MLSKLGLGEAGIASLLPRYTSPSRNVDEHHLAELSPRPEHALLANDGSDHSPGHASAREAGGARVKMSVAFQEPPWSPGGSGAAVRGYRAEKKAYQTSRKTSNSPESWRPPFASATRASHAEATGPQFSFFENMFMARPTYSERSASTNVDQSFKLIDRRERQMQKELQRLLDAQDYALEKHLANTTPQDDIALRLGTSESTTPDGLIVPVRQPKNRRLSKREARLGIARCMSQLSDLKNEEEAYIATALGERKAALSKLRNLSTKRNSIIAEMKAVETDHDQPLQNEIRRMEHQHRAVRDDILKLEEKLRDLKRTQTNLESSIAEARSVRDSELSGYRNALSECNKRIDDIMNYPDVSVLEVEGLITQSPDIGALVGQHISGFEFLSLRPERRTLPMAKDWWEGEVQVLELRKVAVEKERAALDEGTQLWQDILDRLEAHDRHLKSTFNAISEYSSCKQQQRASQSDGLGEILKQQYIMCKETMRALEELYEYTEAQGWKLLITALGAEMNYFHGLKRQLGDTLRFVGWADGVVTPRTSMNTPSRVNSRDKSDLLDQDGHIETTQGKGLNEDITGSILRRWDGTDELRGSASYGRSHIHTTTDDRNEMKHGTDTNDDNRVPSGLFGDARHGSEYDEHNDVPPEFLSMHSPSPRSRGAANIAATYKPAPEPEGEMRRENQRVSGKDENGKEKEEAERPPLSRESSANEVPPDLLAESHHILD